jgi:hypothetical protein
VLAIRNCNCFLENWMVWFGILDCLIFLTRCPSVLLEADMSVTVVSCIVVFVAKTLSRS